VEQGQTVVPLSFEQAGSVFIVFRAKVFGDHLVDVKSDAAPVAKPPLKPADLRILKAVYGHFPDSGQDWVDVTADVRALVANGTRQIPANNDLAGDDPAPMTVKELRIDFRVKGGSRTAKAREGQTVDLPAGSEVVKAIYGDLHPQTAGSDLTVDLTGKLDALVKGGQLNVRINNALAGGDPARLVSKELRVDYSLDGSIKHTIAQENETLTLPETTQASATPLTFAFASGANGQNRLLAWEPATFHLRWASGRQSETECASVPAPVELEGAWDVRFPPGWGAPAQVMFERLQSWPENSETGIKYFSGTATYIKEFEIPAELVSSNRELWLDLGVVKNLAEVSLNGTPLGILWKPPFRIDVTGTAKPGKNRLEIKVTNLWPNRLIGDEQLPPDCEWKGKQLKGWPQWLLEGKQSPTGRLTFTTWHHWKKEDALLMGPVTLRAAEMFECR